MKTPREWVDVVWGQVLRKRVARLSSVAFAPDADNDPDESLYMIAERCFADCQAEVLEYQSQLIVLADKLAKAVEKECVSNCDCPRCVAWAEYQKARENENQNQK